MKSEVFTHPAVKWSNTIIMMHGLAFWICHPTLKNTNTSIRITPNKINKEKLTNSCIVAGGNIHFFYFYLLPFLFLVNWFAGEFFQPRSNLSQEASHDVARVPACSPGFWLVPNTLHTSTKAPFPSINEQTIKTKQKSRFYGDSPSLPSLQLPSCNLRNLPHLNGKDLSNQSTLHSIRSSLKLSQMFTQIHGDI